MQSGLMASLFLGEIFRFGVFARGMLVFSALGFAVFGNFLRATTLSILASTQGLKSVDKWHDTAGFATLAFTLGALWLVAYLWHRYRTRRLPPHPPEPAPIPPLDSRLRVAGIGVFALAVLALAGT